MGFWGKHRRQRKLRAQALSASHMFQRVFQHLDRAGVLSVTVPGVSHWNGYNSFRASESIYQCQIHLINVVYLYFSELHNSSWEVFLLQLNIYFRHRLYLSLITLLCLLLVWACFPQGTSNLIISTFKGYILTFRLSFSNMSRVFSL